MPSSLPADLLDDFTFGPAQGRGKANLSCEIVRELTAEDLPALQDRSLVPSVTHPALTALRSAHHQLAQLIAKGLDQETVCLITGYSTAYVSRLRTDPAFSKLLEYYEVEREQVFVDVLARMRDLGLATLEELQARLVEDPDSFSIRELHEQAKILLPQQGQSGQSPSNGPSAGVQVNVQFITPGEPPVGRPTLELQANSTEGQKT